MAVRYTRGMALPDSHDPLPLNSPVAASAPLQVRRGIGPALLWACFLGCSWTWVIGMLMPVMMVRDFGVWGWVAFAVPNVVGAAAMGTVLRRPEVSASLVRRHGRALRWFSAVTIVFHLYVVTWLTGAIWAALVLVVVWLVMGPERRRAVGRALPWAAVGVAALSWGAFSMAGRLEGAWLDVGRDVLPSRLGPADLWLLLPGILGGFLLCPYLDPSFHRARYSTGPMTGRAAFLVGFGVVFGSMIVFTLMYAGVLRPVLEPGDVGLAWEGIASPWKAILAIHAAVQVGFTLLVHSRERFETVGHGDGVDPAGFLLLLIVALAWAAASRSSFADVAGLSRGELGYRLFILFYAAYFPGYVLICMIPTLRSWQAGTAPPPRRWRRLVFFIAATLAYLAAVPGFITGPTWAILGTYAALLLGRLVVELLPGEATATTPSAP